MMVGTFSILGYGWDCERICMECAENILGDHRLTVHGWMDAYDGYSEITEVERDGYTIVVDPVERFTTVDGERVYPISDMESWEGPNGEQCECGKDIEPPYEHSLAECLDSGWFQDQECWRHENYDVGGILWETVETLADTIPASYLPDLYERSSYSEDGYRLAVSKHVRIDERAKIIAAIDNLNTVIETMRELRTMLWHGGYRPKDDVFNALDSMLDDGIMVDTITPPLPDMT